MIQGSTTELIWHFAGYLHVAKDYIATRLNYDEISYDYRIADFRSADVGLASSRYELADIKSMPVRVTLNQNTPHGDTSFWQNHEHVQNHAVLAPATPSSPWLPDHHLEFSFGGGLESLTGIHMINRFVYIRHVPSVPDLPAEPPEPTYKIAYTPGGDDKIADLNQINVATDRDVFTDGPPEYDVLHPIVSTEALPAMISAAEEFIPDLSVQPGTASKFWTETVIEHNEALKSGEETETPLEPGRYVNGELQVDTPHEAPPKFTPPTPPEHLEDDTDPAQVAQLGSNEAQNLALIADLNEAPSTLVVVGDYFETNAIYQTNILRDQDRIFDAGGSPTPVQNETGPIDNIATFTAKELVKQGVVSDANIGNLNVKIEFVEGNLVDVKTLIQRNLLQDGDVSIQTKFDAYAEIHTGEGEQYNVAKFVDWGKHYDLIIVLGDYHSANIISQTNIVFDNDVIGVGSSSGAGTVFSGQNSLVNDAAITKYGATTFAGLTGNISEIVDALGEKGDLSRETWSNIHGAATGTLNVLFVTGDYYDLNIISQVNVISDADLAVQLGLTDQGSGLQWLSTGGNLASNHAEIVNAGGVYAQYLGGDFYEDSVLVQANLVSEGTETTTTDPTALVSELVAFMDHSAGPSSDEMTWTKDIFSNQDIFSHVLT
ncbi:hypothetical protein AB4072_07415 [Microvirga sp. 2MCAF38]|uniref:hypothetical protein n=1 Tax=Microvirga sp. 2MCAF38 TaxID=3232989 RepID=UPI003F979116